MVAKQNGNLHLPCNSENCEHRAPPFFARHYAVIPWVSLVFFIAPVLWTLGHTVWRVWDGNPTKSPKAIVSVGLLAVPRSELQAKGDKADFTVVVLVTFLALASNMVRLYLSMWLTEEAYWQCEEDAPELKPRFLREGLWRLVAFVLLYMAGWFCPTRVPFEYLILACYVVCVVWDVLAVYKKNWYPLSARLPAIRKGLKNWLTYDILGCIATAIYICVHIFLPLSAKATWMILGVLSLFYVLLLVLDWKATTFSNGQRQVSC